MERIAGTKKPAPVSPVKHETVKEVAKSPVTVIIVENKKEQDNPEVKKEEDDKTPKSALAVSAFIKKAKRTPFIDSTKVNEITMSPLSNLEGIRQKNFGSFGDESSKAELMTEKTSKSVTKFEESKPEAKAPLEDIKSDIEKPKKDIVLCACGNECEENNQKECNMCASKLKDITHSGYLYEKGDKQILVRRWFALIGRQLYSTAHILIDRI